MSLLRRYYGEGASDPSRIEEVRGGVNLPLTDEERLWLCVFSSEKEALSSMSLSRESAVTGRAVVGARGLVGCRDGVASVVREGVTMVVSEVAVAEVAWLDVWTIKGAAVVGGAVSEPDTPGWYSPPISKVPKK